MKTGRLAIPIQEGVRVMNASGSLKSVVAAALAVGGLCASAKTAAAYTQVDLVSNIPGLATVTDPLLVNPWGISHSATSPFWLSNQGTNTSTLYAVTGRTDVTQIHIPPNGFVGIPTTATGPQGPTGQVFNSNTSSFLVGGGGNGGPAHFIFANLNGTISAWDTGATAFIQPSATISGAVYTGLAINQTATTLFAADNAGGAIDVFDSSFAPKDLGAGAFATPTAIKNLGFVPFNVQDIAGNVYVTYAPASLSDQEHAALGQGAVAVFSESGTLELSLVGSQLAAPWGVALAPANFSQFGGDLLVGNFSYDHSEINAFNPTNWMFEGSIPINPGAGDTAGGLWALNFGIGGANGSPDTLYFADGINGQAAGLFGAISAPEPSTWAMMLIGLAGLGFAARRRRSSPLAIG